MTSLATAFVEIRPDTKMFGTLLKRDTVAASALAGSSAGDKMGSTFKSKMGTVAKLGGLALGGAAAIGAVSFIRKSGQLEAAFSKTMNQFQASTDLPVAGMKKMQDLALKMGADTVFSAADAADAMLALAKSGIKPAAIEAGALKSALTLAAAGELDMKTGAEVMANALNTFNLKARDAASAAAALAGAANASSASVHSIALGLAQVGTVANDAGFTIQETTGAIAALANAGIQGSDAGTSLKTMFAALVPATAKTKDAFQEYGFAAFSSKQAMDDLAEKGIKPLSGKYGDVYKAISKYVAATGEAAVGTDDNAKATEKLLWSTGAMGNAFVKANGDFKSLGSISQSLKDNLGDLSDSERGAALRTMFGSDARRAATVLMEEGSKGLAKYVKATSNQGAAEKMAAAAMKGTAGATEALKGSWETLQIQFGLFTAPARIKAMEFLTSIVNAIAPAIKGVVSAFKGGGGGLSGFGAQIGKTGAAIGVFVKSLIPTFKEIGEKLGGAFHDVGVLIKDTLLPAFQKLLPILAPVVKFLLKMFGGAIVGFIKGAVQAIKGFVNVITGVVDLIVALVHGDWSKAWDALKQIVGGIFDTIIGLIKMWFNFGILAIFKSGAKMLLGSWKGLWGGIKSLGSKALSGINKLIGKAFGFIKGLFVNAIKGYWNLWKGLFNTLKSILVNGWRVLRSAFGGAMAAVRTIIVQAVKAYIGFWKGLFTKLKGFAVAGWKALKSMFSGAFTAVRKLFTDAAGKYIGFWKGLFNALKTVAKKLWDTITGVFSKAFTKIKSAFGAVTTAIKKAWDKIKAIVKKPIIAVVAIINNGLIDPFNKVSGALKGPKIGRLSPGFSRGGYTGPGARMQPAGIVHADEFVVNSPARKRIERRAPGFLDELNHGKLSRLPGYFLGGGVKPAVGGVSRHGGYSWANWAGDISVPGSGDYGNPVRAWKAGIVAAVQHLTSSYGNNIRVNHAGNQKTLYAHLSRILVNGGQRVSQGQMIGRVGSTGNSTGPHLHFELAGGSDAVTAGGGGGGFSNWMRRETPSFLSTLAEGIQNAVTNPMAFLKDKIAGPIQGLLSRFGNSKMAQMVVGAPRTLLGAAADKIKSLFGIAETKYNKQNRKTSQMFNDPGLGPASVAGGSAQAIVKAMNARRGWGEHWGSLYRLVQAESSWNPNAANPTTSARGLFQKMTSIHGPVEGTVAGQARWGLNYIGNRYGNPSNAWSFHQRNNSYDGGGVARGRGYMAKQTMRPERVLSPRQTESFDRLVNLLERQGGGDTKLYVYDVDGVFRGMVRAEAKHEIRSRERTGDMVRRTL